MLNPTEHDILARACDELATASYADRGAVARRVAQALGCSLATAYRKLGQAGHASGRKRRSDANTCVLSDDQLELVAGVLHASLNNKGQRMPVATALAMLRAGGRLDVDVHESTVSRQLYRRRMHPEQLALPTPSVQLRSLHPNHVWQIDSTTGAYYYLPGGRLRWMPEDRFYKNKVGNLVKAASDLLTRYSAVDHTSHAGKVRHYLGGESSDNLLDFATWAMARQDGTPLHGVPFVLMTDPGPASGSRIFKKFCRRVGIRHLRHEPGAARVTGSVEKYHDLVRMHFETRLRFFDPSEVTLERLNAEAEAWCAAYCASEIHTRHGRTRYGLWMTVRPEQLRVPVSLEALREAASTEPETRRVSNLRRITFGRPSRVYALDLVPGAVAGLTVTVQSNPFRSPSIDVRVIDADTGEESWHVVQPLEFDEHGYAVDAPVIGEEMRSAAYSDVDRNRRELTRRAYKTGDELPTLAEAAAARRTHQAAYAGVVDAMADVRATTVPTYLPKRGTVHELPERKVEARRITVVEACALLKRRLGAAYTPQVFAHLSAEHPDGVPEDRLDALAEFFAPRTDEQAPDARTAGGAA